MIGSLAKMRLGHPIRKLAWVHQIMTLSTHFGVYAEISHYQCILKKKEFVSNNIYIYIYIFDNHGCPGQLTRTSTNPMALELTIRQTSNGPEETRTVVSNKI